MKIRLLKDKLEEGRVKTTIRRNRGQGIVWLTGAVIEVSDETGKKLVKNGEAEVVTEEVAAEAQTEES